MKKINKILLITLLVVILFLLTGCESDILSSTVEIKENSVVNSIEKVIPKNNSYIINDDSTISYFYNRNIFKIDDEHYQVRYTTRNLDTNMLYTKIYYLRKISINTWGINQIENYKIKGDIEYVNK